MGWTRERTLLLTTLVGAGATVAAAEVWAGSMSDAGDPGTRPDVRRAENVVILPKRVEALPPRPAGRLVLLLGNSHTYALPGLRRGQGLRPDPGATLVDELARAAGQHAQVPVTFERLAYPNFLPTEMLFRFAHLLQREHAPDVIVLGLTWRNVARDSRPRHEVRSLLRDRAFVSTLRRMLREARAPAPLTAFVDEEVRRVAREMEEERQRSHADEIDAKLTEHLGESSSLFGGSASVRARIYRALSQGIGAAFVRESDGPNAAVEDDIALNVAAARAIFALARARGIRVLVYQAPERSDLPPIVDVTRRDEVMGRLGRELRASGQQMIDAREVVPARYWGYEHETADRSHFTEPGHRLLADFIVRETAASGFWDLSASR